MRAFGVAGEVVDGLCKGIDEAVVGSREQRAHNLTQDMHGAHRHLAGGGLDPRHHLGGVGEETLQRSGSNRCPDEPLDDGGILGIAGGQSLV